MKKNEGSKYLNGDPFNFKRKKLIIFVVKDIASIFGILKSINERELVIKIFRSVPKSFLSFLQQVLSALTWISQLLVNHIKSHSCTEYHLLTTLSDNTVQLLILGHYF
jgi:hypothetical protein